MVDKDRSKERENSERFLGLIRVAPDCCCVSLLNVQPLGSTAWFNQAWFNVQPSEVQRSLFKLVDEVEGCVIERKGRNNDTLTAVLYFTFLTF